MAGRHELLASQIDDDLGHKGFEFGEKERGQQGGFVLPFTLRR